MPLAEAEVLRARLLEVAPDGFEEVEDGSELELAVYTDAAHENTVREMLGGGESRPVARGWEERWRAFHRPVRAGGLWIGPPWERQPAGEVGVVIDPGRAFGTGAHATTRACIELLARLERGALLDAGCGSGVVAIAAARLEFDPVFAADIDSVAVEVTQANARRNGVRVEALRLDVLRDELPHVDRVVANIELVAVEALLARVPARHAVVSGFLAHERVRATGWRMLDRLELDGWAAELLAYG